EEERRLFYVAITRAEKEVVLSYSASRYKWGNLIFCEPSRFIEEIDRSYLEFMFTETTPAKSTSSDFSDDYEKYNQAKHTNKMPPKRNEPQKTIVTPPKNLKKVTQNSIGIS